MDTASAWAMGMANRGRESMVFDWDKAARRINEVKPYVASAGLAGDWEWTGGEIYKDGGPIPEGETYTYLASTWATPELDLDGNIEDCYVMESKTEWDSDTYWPPSALAILSSIDAEVLPEVKEIEQ